MRLLILFFFCCVYSLAEGQSLATGRIDNMATSIDNDTSLQSRVVFLDTLYKEPYGAMVKEEVSFTVYYDPKFNQIRKIVWNNEGKYYCYVTIYYHQGNAVKGVVKATYHRTDTNPEFETNTVFYIKGESVTEEKELNGNSYKANGFWYLSTINKFVKLAALKLK